ncbi:hypothetical protein BH09ACT6_BH09ACT6_03840 [soil metagenome]
MADAVPYSLGLPAGWVAEPSDGPGTRYLYLGAGPVERPRAVAQLDLLPRIDAGPQAFIDRMRRDTPAAVRVRRREATVGTVAGLPAAVMHELLEIPGPPSRAHQTELEGRTSRAYGADEPDAPAPAAPRGPENSRVISERFAAALFPPGTDVIVHFQLFTSDLAAFDDLVAVGLSMAGSVQLHKAIAS